MADDDAWARPPEGEESGDGTPTEKDGKRPRWVLPVLLGVLAVVVIGAVWVVAASKAATEFADRMGEAPSSGSCGADLTDQDLHPTVRPPADLPAELDEVVAAYDAFYAQDRWSFSETGTSKIGNDEPTSSNTRFSVDGDTIERRDLDDGFIGRARGSSGVVQFEGDRFWIAGCPNTMHFKGVFTDADCIRSETEGDTVRVTWATVRDGSCDDELLRHSATIVDGELRRWSIEAEGRFGSTSTVEPPVSLSWPSPLWVVPNLLAKDDN